MADSVITTFPATPPGTGKGNSGSFWPSWAQGNSPGKGTQNPSPAAPAGPAPATGDNPNYPNNPATQYMGQPLNPGDQHPFSNDPWTMLSPQAAPGAGYSNFLPSVFRDPYLGSMNAASQVGTAAGMALPNAAAFQSDLYGPGLTGMEQAFMRSAGDQGLRGLNQTLNRVEAQFENAPLHGALGAMSMDAANQFATNMMNMGAQMGTQRQNTAAGTLGTTFQLPLQAGQQSQEAASGLYNMMTQAMYGDMQYPSAMYSSYPFIAPAISQPTGGGKGK
jgi:hypothetical protein